MNSTTWIDVNDLPHSVGGFSLLFCDYLNDFQRVHHYFETDFHSLQQIPKLADRLRQHYSHRSLLVEILTEQNQKFGVGVSTLENIKHLADEKTFAVVTGQQLGILGGPLYTVYKAITAIKLSKQLSVNFPEYKFVPVFWLESEDHDFEEVNKVGILSTEHVPTKIEYLPHGKPLQKNPGPIGELRLDGYLDSFYDQLQKSLGNSEFKKPLVELLASAYKPEASFEQAFAVLMNTLFDGEGLIFISPNDKRLKTLLAPIFQKEIQEFPRVSQLIIQQSAELENRYHAQIKTKALNLFHFFKGGRYFIEPREHDFSLRGTRHFIPKDELLRIATETPELLSPNVALRPICQDTILPTVAYVAGPSEIAYFAQLKSVYQYFGITMPMIYPRASTTILEEKIERIMEKYELDILDFFGDPEKVNNRVIELASEVRVDEMFQSAIQRVNDQVNEMRFGLNYIDSTLLGALETTRSKLEFQLHALREKTMAAQKQKHEVALRQVQKASHSIFPNKNFQERELSIVHFMNKHGLEFVRWLL
ncbi:MAG: bacillithiol biosynthesis cysteine-adding enzyme BshC, partial [Ignavibacteriales bacterium]|nr:bacillithiol biosynthesis cysteine-adding enzyme BshC [Ignavibacteriales bacterium]